MLEITGDLMVGDGLATLLAPRGHMRLWQTALPWSVWQRFVAWFAARPGLTRLVGGSQIVLGGWLLARASRDVE
jgi:hypothetical protein